jgi:hypothetical protein
MGMWKNLNDSKYVGKYLRRERQRAKLMAMLPRMHF